VPKILKLKPDLVLTFSDLQPGPAALTDGLEALESIVSQWANRPAARVA
jgi:hypothetical protein